MKKGILFLAITMLAFTFTSEAQSGNKKTKDDGKVKIIFTKSNKTVKTKTPISAMVKDVSTASAEKLLLFIPMSFSESEVQEKSERYITFLQETVKFKKANKDVRKKALQLLYGEDYINHLNEIEG